MKSEIVENKKSFYPRLMKIVDETDSDDETFVVCFTRENCGVLVYPTDHRDFMKPFDGWRMDCFTEFNDKVIISN